MGYDYALVHLKYTIPPAVALTVCYKPLCTSLGIYKILFLITIAVVSTTPWDSYLIHSRIWTYPPNAIIGPTLFKIPVEEIFFFVIQTYNTSLLYLLVSKPTFHPVYLRGKTKLNDGDRVRLWRRIGILIIAAAIAIGIYLVTRKGQGLYLGLILVWAGPFVLLLWTLAYQLILGLPLSNTVLPIGLPTVYLWIVDTLALKRGTWVIESGTKLGWHLWDGLETEEAVFFLVTNTLIVFGLIAFDNGFAILQAFPDLFPEMPPLPSPILLIGALLISSDSFDAYRIKGLKEALTRLSAKSRSFCLASVFFEGRLREDLILLYSYCRVADDLVDEASSSEDARHSILNLQDYLNLRYNKDFRPEKLSRFIESNFPPFAYSALELLPARHLSSDPFRKMLSGFGTDLKFTSSDNPFPIKDEDDLKVYASQVAGTVAVLCLKLVFHHCKPTVPEPVRSDILLSGESMGIALQFVNIARDISKDAAHGRVYLPTSWLAEEGLTPGDVTKESSNPRIDKVRERLLDLAFEIYGGCKSSIEELPYDVRGPIRVAVESYFEIGRVLREPGHKTKAGRATVPKLRRLKVAWKAC